MFRRKGTPLRNLNSKKFDTSQMMFLVSFVLVLFLVLLYVSCAYPGLFGLRPNKPVHPREHVDTFHKDVRQLSPDSAAALKLSIEGIPNLGKETENASAQLVQRPSNASPAQNTNSAVVDRVQDLKFTVQMHGFQCLVYTLHARKFSPAGVDDVSWVTQLTADRLPIFKTMLERWKGPVSAALYSQNLEADLREIASLRDRVDFHIVGASQGLYPVNTLRNVAINNCKTNYLILADVDFVPSANIYDYVTSQLPVWRQDPKAVYVFPAFEIDGADQHVPESKDALVAMGPKIHQVHNDKGREIAHKYSEYSRWMTATEPYQAKYKFPYEPYFLAPKSIPRYDVRFFGYGNDKASHCYELNAAGFKFMIAPQAFVVHVTHPQGSWVQASFIDPKERLSKTLTTFLSDVDRRYIKRVSTNENLVFPPLPPSAQYQPVISQLRQSCWDACKEVHKVCRAEWAERINMCRELEKHFACTYGCNDNFFGSDLPAFNTQREQCLINQSPVANPFSCDSTYDFSRRLCPCGSPP